MNALKRRITVLTAAGAAVVAVGVTAPIASAAAPARTTTPSAWVPATKGDVWVDGVAVHGNAGLVIWARERDGRQIRQAVLLRRNGPRTQVVRRVAFPARISSLVRVVADGHGRWLVLLQDWRAHTASLTRLTAAGTVDRSFGTAGAATFAVDATDLTVDSHDRPVLLVVRPDPSAPLADGTTVMRLTSSGRPDGTFGDGGYANAAVDPATIASAVGAAPTAPAGWTLPQSVAVTSSDRIVTSGGVTNIDVGTAAYVQRLTATGQRDATFGTGDGTVTFGRRSVTTDQIILGTRLSVTRTGSLYLLGQFGKNTRQIVWKRTPTGAADRTFGTAGWGWAGPSGQVVQSSTMCDGGLVQTGAQKIAVFTPAGRPDMRFGRNGVIPVALRSPLGTITGAAVDSRPCPTNYLAASPRRRGVQGGFTVVWLSLPASR